MVELVYTRHLKCLALKGLWVQVPPEVPAFVAQLVEQGFCKALVAGSSPVEGLPTMGTTYKEHDYPKILS